MINFLRHEPTDVDAIGVRSLSASASKHTFDPLSDAGDYRLIINPLQRRVWCVE